MRRLIIQYLQLQPERTMNVSKFLRSLFPSLLSLRHLWERETWAFMMMRNGMSVKL
jgi:hypothetical protein